MSIRTASFSSAKTDQVLHAALILIILITLTARILPGNRTIDDAFITFRYARNLVEGQGFVYNYGVQTLGTTTPLYTLLMAGISLLTGRQDFPQYALLINALADSLTVMLLYAITRALTGNRWLALLPSLLWSIAPYSVTFAIGGMETSVVILWMTSAVWVLMAEPGGRTRSDIALGLLCGLGLFTRIDSALWVGPLLLMQLFERWRSQPRTGWSWVPWRTWSALLAIMLPWMLFSFVYFGSPLPNSLSAKSVAYQMPPTAAFQRLLVHYSLPFMESDGGSGLLLLLGVGYAACSFFAILMARQRFPRVIPFLLYPWIYFIAFSIANPLIFRWYLTPPLPALMIGIIAGLWHFTRPFDRKFGRWIVRAAFVALAAFWMVSLLRNWTLHPDHGHDRPAPEMAWHKIELLYEQVGVLLRGVYGVTDQTRVASADIGAVGYFSRAVIVDTVGLVTPDLSRYYPADPTLILEGQNYAIPPALIQDTAPEFLVTMEGFVRLGLAQQSWFTQEYRLLHTIPFEFYGDGMLIYGRSDNP